MVTNLVKAKFHAYMIPLILNNFPQISWLLALWMSKKFLTSSHKFFMMSTTGHISMAVWTSDFTTVCSIPSKQRGFSGSHSDTRVHRNGWPHIKYPQHDFLARSSKNACGHFDTSKHNGHMVEGKTE